MAKLIALGIAVFFIGGLILEGITNNIMNPQADANALSTADRYIAAHRENKTIPLNPPPDLPKVVEELSLKDCRAENLNPYTEMPVTGTVTRIVDGDTLRINIEGFEMPVRLWGIDAPEMTQTNGPEAKQKLEMLIPTGSRAAVHPVNRDRYGRIVAVVDNGAELAVNFTMVVQGWAYHYRQYDPRINGCLAEAERAARDGRKGVWQDGVNGGERPWERRRKPDI
jgi:endonuclease YncB( thermonuclease family)